MSPMYIEQPSAAQAMPQRVKDSHTSSRPTDSLDVDDIAAMLYEMRQTIRVLQAELERIHESIAILEGAVLKRCAGGCCGCCC